MDQQRFVALCDRLHLSGVDASYVRLVAAYRESHRAYHDESHVDDCLSQLWGIRETIPNVDAIELSLWFHDAVYRPRASDNERKSADWAVQFISDCGPNETLSRDVDRLIMATVHTAAPMEPDAKWLVDIDLSILGRAPERYDQFERGVRKEYAFVPNILFRRGRRKILQSFLDRDFIYHSEWFRSRFEDQARVNLTQAISALS